MAFTLGPVFQSIGDAGSQVAGAQLAAAREKIQRMFDQLGINQAETNIDESKERLRRLKGAPATESDRWQQLKEAFRTTFGREPSDEEMKNLFGLSTPQKATTTESEQMKQAMDAFKSVFGREPTEDEKKLIFFGNPPKSQAPAKPTKTKTYDPAGNLREAFEDASGQVVAWGQLVPVNDAIEKWQDEEGNIHVKKLDRTKKVNPGEIRMSPEAEKQWDTISESAQTPNAEPTGGVGPGGRATVRAPKGGGGEGGEIIGRTTPKYSGPLAGAMKDTQQKYNNWLGAMKNSEFHTPKTDLAIVFSAVRAAVQGAGRMTNVELERELSAGSWGDRFKRQWKMAKDGTLPDDQREDLLRTIRDSWLASAQTARGQWKAELGDNPKTPLPIYMQGEDITPKDGGGGQAAPGGDLYFDKQGNPTKAPQKP